MFLRYFYLISGLYDDSEAEAMRLFECQKIDERVTADHEWGSDKTQPSKVVNGRELVTWDVGVACLALSVKVGVPSISYP
jgi:hypothetical protein